MTEIEIKQYDNARKNLGTHLFNPIYDWEDDMELVATTIEKYGYDNNHIKDPEFEANELLSMANKRLISMSELAEFFEMHDINEECDDD